jgi:pimeloyl-ACP methyl ester carboxylesterase
MATAVRAEDTPAADAAADTAADTAPAGQKPDTEQQFATALRANIKDSKAIGLQVEGQEVLALFKTQTKGEALGAVLLLHDLNRHPDWAGVTSALRRQLPDAGWHSLSLQLPHSDTSAVTVAQLDAIRKRIGAALDELDKRAIKNVVLVGHGLGALAAVDYLSENLTPAVQGLVVISLDGRTNDEPRLDAANRLNTINLPILDIYAARDRLPVVQSAKRRYDMARRSSDDGDKPRSAYDDIAQHYTEKKGLSLGYRQVKLVGANPQFDGQTSDLVKRIRGWLKRYAAGQELKSSD